MGVVNHCHTMNVIHRDLKPGMCGVVTYAVACMNVIHRDLKPGMRGDVTYAVACMNILY